MKLNKKNIIIGIIILLLILSIFLKKCACSASEPTPVTQDTIPSIQNIIAPVKDTIVKVLKVVPKKQKPTTVFLKKADTISQTAIKALIDSLQSALISIKKDYEYQIHINEKFVQENNRLKIAEKQQKDSIKILLSNVQILQREKEAITMEREQEKLAILREHFWTQNILFTGLFPDPKTGDIQKTIYGGLLKEVLLSIDFFTNVPITPENRKQTVYIKISDLQTEQLLYISNDKPKESYALDNGQKIKYSIQQIITFDKNNTASLRITHPMKWVLKRNSAIKIEVFCNKQKIGENINEIKSGTPVTTW